MNILAIILIVSGVFFFFSATMGLLRLPDFYCRMHAVGKGDTLGMLLSLAGIALYNFHNGLSAEALIVSIKIIFVALFIFIASPTATYAITKAGLEMGIKPKTKEDLHK